MSPHTSEPLLVDPVVTRLVLQGGTTRAPLPVGHPGYAAAALSATATAVNPTTPIATAAAARGRLTTAAAASSSIGRLENVTDHTSSSSTSSIRVARTYQDKLPQQQQQQQEGFPVLGVHANAAWHPTPSLPGVCGPLQPTWRELAELVAPLLHPLAWDQGVRLGVLLAGPKGSGKVTAVRAVAAALGMHYIGFSCHELQVGGGGALGWVGGWDIGHTSSR